MNQVLLIVQKSFIFCIDPIKSLKNQAYSDKQIKLFQPMSQDTKQKIKDYNKLIQLDDKYDLHDQQKKKVSSVLQDQLQYLLEKKDKEAQKRKRIKQMEEEFERKRKMKLQQFSIKSQQSQKFKQRHIKEKIQKNKKNLEHVQKVHKKAHQQNRSILRNGLQKRKQFYTEESSKNPKINTKAETQENFKNRSKSKGLNESKLQHSETSRQMDSKKIDVENQMKQIEQKLSKAKQKHLLYQNQLIEKLSEKQRRNNSIHEKIRSHSMLQEQRSFRQLYGKNESILNAEQKIKELTQKHLSERRKSFQDKIKKMHQNIKYLESQKMQKFTQLQSKLSKIYESNPSNRSGGHSRSHHEQVMLNNMKLEEQKKQKAEEILKKHSEITAKNKIYKEKKDQILQAIKKVNPEI